jgi:hypothetical protein
MILPCQKLMAGGGGPGVALHAGGAKSRNRYAYEPPAKLLKWLLVIRAGGRDNLCLLGIS